MRLCWEEGVLRFYDPEAEDCLRSHEDDLDGRLEAETRAEAERTSRLKERIRADAAETRIAELDAELQRLRGQ